MNTAKMGKSLISRKSSHFSFIIEETFNVTNLISPNRRVKKVIKLTCTRIENVSIASLCISHWQTHWNYQQNCLCSIMLIDVVQQTCRVLYCQCHQRNVFEISCVHSWKINSTWMIFNRSWCAVSYSESPSATTCSNSILIKIFWWTFSLAISLSFTTQEICQQIETNVSKSVVWWRTLETYKMFCKCKHCELAEDKLNKILEFEGCVNESELEF